MAEDGSRSGTPDRDGAATLPSLRLPGRALAAIYLAFSAVALLLAASRPVAPFSSWEKLAAALGVVALIAMAMQFVTSGRFDRVSGRLGIDRIMAFHKLAAWSVLAALVGHLLFYFLPTWLDDPALGVERFVAYFTAPSHLTGVVALGAVLLLAVSSILRDRLPWRYEVWRGSHIVLASTAVGTGLHHAVSVGRFSAAGPLHWLWWVVGFGVVTVVGILYGWRWLKLHLRPWRLASVEKRADRMWELDIQPEAKTPPLPYRAGQFVWMTTGRRRFPLLDNPFSIADSPTRPGLSLIIKEAGDFTRTVGQLPPGTPVGIDGPYGEFTLGTHPGSSVLLIAGGVGIAPIMGLLRDLVARRDPRPIRLAYAAGQPDNFACLEEIEAAKQVLDLKTALVSEEGGEGWHGAVGRLDRDRLSALLEGLDRQCTVAFMCGPGPMVTAVSDTLLDLGLPMSGIIYERFDYRGGLGSRMDRIRTLSYLAVGSGLLVLAGVFALV